MDQARRALETQLAHHIAAAAGIRRRLNALVAIARLPPEILSEIFICCTDELQSGTRITITHVCHFWREVALNTLGLWTKIDLSYSTTEAVRAYLARSKHALLKIAADAETDPPITSLRLAAQHWSQAESIRLSLSPLTYSTIATYLPSSTPLLKSLRVCMRPESEITYEEPAVEFAAPVPIYFDQSTAPLLQSLEIDRYCLEWTTHIFPRSLTHITVIYSSGAADFSDISTLDVVRVIGSLSLLQRLKLRNVLPSLPPSTTSLPPTELSAALPDLRLMDVAASALSCVHFLNHFTLPVSVGITLFFTSCPGSALPFLVAPLRSKLLHLKPELEVLSIELLPEETHHIQILSEISESCHPDIDLKTPFFELYAQNCDFGCGAVLQEVFAHLPLRSILKVFVGSDAYDEYWQDQAAWLDAMKTMVNVESLTVQENADLPLPPDVLYVLGAQSRQNTSPSIREPPIMPKLRRVELNGVGLRETDDSRDLAIVAQLCEVFRSRLEAGFQVESVSVEKCLYVNAGDIALFQQYVSEVHWDGVVRQVNEDEDFF